MTTDMRSLFITAALALGFAASAQNYNDLIEVVRSDIRAEKQAIVLANMGLTEEQSAKFNPIYDEYSMSMKQHWDKRIALIKEYVSSYNTLTDEGAKSLLKRSDMLEKEALVIRNTYEKKMMKVLPVVTVARWVQIERTLGYIMNLQISSEVPLLPSKK